MNDEKKVERFQMFLGYQEYENDGLMKRVESFKMKVPTFTFLSDSLKKDNEDGAMARSNTIIPGTKRPLFNLGEAMKNINPNEEASKLYQS